MERSTRPPAIQRFAWTVPLVLMFAITISLFLHWPIYSGILVGLSWSAIYARWMGTSWREITLEAILGARRMWLICCVLLIIGAVVALWMACGTIPLLVNIGGAWLKTGNLIWMSFFISTLLSMVIGSSIATWSVLGPPFMAMSPLHATGWVAGALISGGMVGDRSSPMSTSTVLMSSTSGVRLKETLRHLNQSALLPWGMTALGFVMVNRFLIGDHHQTVNNSTFPTIQWLLLLPPLLVIGLALLRIPLLYNLLIALMAATTMTLVTSHPSFIGLLRGVWSGLPSASNHTSHIGGVSAMISAVLLIACAGAFQGVTARGKSIDVVTSVWFSRIHRPWTLVLSAYAVCALYAMMVGSQMLAILMSGNTLRPHFQRLGLGEVHLLQVIGDAAELLPALIPWNLLGLQAVVILGVPAGHAVPFAWFIIITLVVSMVKLAQQASVKLSESISLS